MARRLATCPALAHATLTLHGDLGAGKTTFVRHLLRALGVQGRIKSPTYAVVEPHTTGTWPLLPAGQVLTIAHFDFYRFTDPREWEDAGLREMFAHPGLKLVEWPQRAAGVMPPPDAELHIEPEPVAADAVSGTVSGAALDGEALPDSARRVWLNALTPTGQQLLAALRG